MDSIKEHTHQKFLQYLKGARTKTGWKILIVDDTSMRCISSACGMYDIMESGVTLVEPLKLRREPQPNMEAVYYITPDEESINLVFRDFRETPTMYAGVHFLFTKRIPDSIIEKLKEAPFKKRIKSCKEAYLEYLAFEQRCFHLDMDLSLYNLYSPNAGDIKDTEVRTVADKLVTVFASMRMNPIIRHGSTHHVAANVASVLQQRFDAFPVKEWDMANKGKPRPVVLVLDRTYDVGSMLIHELTYQAMCHDLLDIRGDMYEIEKDDGSKERVLINENDILWPTLRHKHIADTSQHLTETFRKFINSNKAAIEAVGDANKVQTLTDMSETLRALPEFQELKAKYALHISLADACIHRFGNEYLEQMCSLEQSLITGSDKDYKAVKKTDAARDITNSLKQAGATRLAKLRLMLLYLATQTGITEDNVQSLAQTAGFGEEDMNVIQNIRALGVELDRQEEKQGVLGLLKKLTKKKERAKYELSRYVPPLKEIQKQLVENSLSTDEFPYIKPNEVIKGAAKSKNQASMKPASWATETRKQTQQSRDSKAGGRMFFIFIVGGMGYSEMRVTYESSLELNHQLFIGSTGVMEPNEFVRMIQHFSDDEAPEPPPHSF